MPIHTKDRLGDALRDAGLQGLAIRAREGAYDDFLSPSATPQMDLARELAAIGTAKAMALRTRVINGEFDATREEGAAWAGSQDGRETFDKLASQRNRAERRAAGERGRPERPERLGDAPVQDEYRQQMNAIAAALDGVLNEGPDRKTGFVLLVFPFGDAEGGRTNFISNGADRRDIVTLMKEMISRFEGQAEPKPGHA